MAGGYKLLNISINKGIKKENLRLPLGITTGTVTKINGIKTLGGQP